MRVLHTPGARQPRVNSTPSTRHVHAKYMAAMPVQQVAPPLVQANRLNIGFSCISMQEPFGLLSCEIKGLHGAETSAGGSNLVWPRLPEPKCRRPGPPLRRWWSRLHAPCRGRSLGGPLVSDIGSLLMRGVKTEESRAHDGLSALEGQRLAVRIGFKNWDGPVRGRCEQLPLHLAHG